MSVKPPRLRLGDTIGIIAPASNIKPDYLDRGCAELRRLGFEVKYGASIFEKDRFTAGTDRRRAEELNTMFEDSSVRAVFAARGGYGSVRILDLVDAEILSKNPKVFLGCSDITTLHLFLRKRFGWVTFHGPMAAGDFARGGGRVDLDAFHRVLCEAQPAGALRSAGCSAIAGGKAEGILIGGCLPLICASIGTPYEIDTSGAILFLEDTSSKPYQIDRMLEQLKRAGKFSTVSGVVFGEMLDCVQHPDQGYSLEEVIADSLSSLNVPILYGFRSGHTSSHNITLPLGVRATLDSDAQTLRIDEAAVREGD